MQPLGFGAAFQLLVPVHFRSPLRRQSCRTSSCKLAARVRFETPPEIQSSQRNAGATQLEQRSFRFRNRDDPAALPRMEKESRVRPVARNANNGDTDNRAA